MNAINNNVLFGFSISMIVFSLVFNLQIISRIDEMHVTGSATQEAGVVNICINSKPVLSGHDCNFSIHSRMDGILKQKYNCTIDADDPDGTGIRYYLDSNFSVIGRLSGNITISGNISRWNDPRPDNVTMKVILADNSWCSNNLTTAEIVMDVAYQGGVRFIKNYPEPTTDELTIREGFTTFHKSLDEYFIDIDGFDLSYDYVFLDWYCFNINLTIQNGTNLVSYQVDSGFTTENTGPCRAYFNATNPFGLWNVSNIFYITVEPDETLDNGGGGSGNIIGGTGGSGGSSGSTGALGRDIKKKDCILQNVACTEWSECMYQEPDTEEIMLYDLFHDGIMKRSCTWETNCPGELAPAQKQICDFKPSCNDSMRNCHEMQDNTTWCEEGIDCGGPCDPCPTCFDWIQNQKETGIDCGGPCDPCATCFDNVLNCVKLSGGTYDCERFIDCGGPCSPCANCSDNLKNCHRLADGSLECEEGIDCGGPCDKACPALERTAFQKRLRWLNIMLVVILITGLGFTFRALAPKIFEYYERKYMDYVKSLIQNTRNKFRSNYVKYFETQMKSLSDEFDAVTTEQAKTEGDRLLFEGQTTGYNIDRYSVSFDNDYADILTDNSVITINYAMYMDNIEHGKRILKEIAKQGIRPNYRVCKRSSATVWDEKWDREKSAKYEMVNGKLIARTVEYILSFTPKDMDEAKKIVKVLELYGKGSNRRIEDAWDVPDIRVTGQADFIDYEKHILNTKSVAGQKLVVLTKDWPLPDFESSTIWLNPGLAKFIE